MNRPELASREGFYKQVWQDLYARGLVDTENLKAMMTGRGTVERRTTDLGAEFLGFIESPLPEEKRSG